MNDKQLLQVINWSRQKSGTIGMTRDGKNEARFLMIDGDRAIFDIHPFGISVRNLYGKHHNSDNVCHSDILCPWEKCIAEGHNPDGIMNAQVGDGWRLIASLSENPNAEAQIWCNRTSTEKINPHWESRCSCDNPYQDAYTYRVPITKPKRRIPCGPKHFPPGTVVRTAGCHHWQAILWVTPSEVGGMSSNGNSRCKTYDDIMTDTERSTDGGKTWLPCYVEE